MADVKISALPAATTPLDGTELAPIVQSGTTKRVTVANLTVGRALTASSLTLTTPLSAGNGGTGTSTVFTAGSVVFAGASGIYGQDNANLFWDDSNNRLGIGTATPAGPLQIGSTPSLLLDASGNLGIGTGSPNGRVHGRQDSAGGTTYTLIADNGAGGAGTNLAAVAFQNAGSQKASIRAAVYGNGYMAFHTDNDTEKMRIESSGNLLVGTTSTSNTVVGWKFLPAVNGSGFICDTTGDGPSISFTNINATIANGYRWFSFRINSGGTQAGSISYNTGTSQVLYNQTSDRRIKSNITPALPVLEKMKQVEVVSFDMGQGHTDYGVIAQDLHKLFPEAVSVGDDLDKPKTLWGFAGASLVPAMVKAIQELAAKVSALEAKQ